MIEILIILFGLFFGFIIIYFTSPKPRIITKYPTLENIDNTTYVDEIGQKYKYYIIEVPCSE